MTGYIVEEMDPRSSRYVVEISDGKKMSIKRDNFFKVEHNFTVPIMKIEELWEESDKIFGIQRRLQIINIE